MRYRSDGVPIRGMGAFMPGLILNGVSFGAGFRRIAGFPGTMPVPVDHDQHLSANGADPRTLQSNCAPDVILPTVYIPGTRDMGPWASRGAMHTPGIYGGGNPLPEPAGAPSGIPLPAARPAKIGGQRVIGMPRVAPRWPSLTTGSG